MFWARFDRGSGWDAARRLVFKRVRGRAQKLDGGMFAWEGVSSGGSERNEGVLYAWLLCVYKYDAKTLEIRETCVRMKFESCVCMHVVDERKT